MPCCLVDDLQGFPLQQASSGLSSASLMAEAKETGEKHLVCPKPVPLRNRILASFTLFRTSLALEAFRLQESALYYFDHRTCIDELECDRQIVLVSISRIDTDKASRCMLWAFSNNASTFRLKRPVTSIGSDPFSWHALQRPKLYDFGHTCRRQHSQP